MRRQPRGRLRPPNWNRTLATLRDAVRTGEINGTAGEMAAQVRTIIERADMLNYQPNTLITAVEWPMGWGEAIKPACAELGLKTLAEVHEAAKSEQRLRELSRKIAATAKINYLTDLARKVCGQLTEAEKKRQKYVEPPAEQKAEWAKQREAPDDGQERGDPVADLGPAPRMTRPEGMRAGRVIGTYNSMDKALRLIHAGCTSGQVARELMVEEKKLYDWAKKYPEFAKLSGLDSGTRKRGRKAAAEAPKAGPDVVQEIIRQEVDEDVRRASLAHEREMDGEPFPPFPEDEPTADARPRTGYHTCPADKNEKPQFRVLDLQNAATRSTPAALEDLAAQVYAMADGQAEAYTKLNDRVTDLRDQLRAELAAGAAKYQQLFEEVGRIGEHVAEALGKLWVGDAATDPFIRGLVQHLPPPGSAWSLEDRRRWIHCAETVFSLMYKLPEQGQGFEQHLQAIVETGRSREAAELLAGGLPTQAEADALAQAAQAGEAALPGGGVLKRKPPRKATPSRRGKKPAKTQPAGLIRRARQPIAAA